MKRYVVVVCAVLNFTAIAVLSYGAARTQAQSAACRADLIEARIAARDLGSSQIEAVRRWSEDAAFALHRHPSPRKPLTNRGG